MNMKKNQLGKKICCCILITAFISGVGQATIINNDARPTNRAMDWTIMMYLVGDNNLSAAQGQVLQNIRAGWIVCTSIDCFAHRSKYRR